MARKQKTHPNARYNDLDAYDEEMVLIMPKPVKEFSRVTRIGDRKIRIDFRMVSEVPIGGYVERNKPDARRAYTNFEQFQARINNYFKSCDGPLRDRYGSVIRDKDGDPVIGQVKPYTLSGLARAIGMSTPALKSYGRGRNDDMGFYSLPEYSDIIIAARHKVEEYAETRSYDRDGSMGARFILDAGFGWHTTKERADIKNAKKLTKLKQLEFELKKSLIEAGEDDSDITINIVRGKKNE